MAVSIGKPWPLGSSLVDGGVNFSVAAPEATKVELLLFESGSASEPNQIIELNQRHRSGDYWHVEVQGIGIGCCYGYLVHGPVSSAGRGFHPTKVLLDPCARAISGWDIYDRGLATGDHDNSAHCLKAVVTERDHFDFNSHPRPRHDWRETVIYELHPGGFSRDLSSPARAEHRGTFLGLIDALPYLQSLGITAIELLPSMAFDPADAPDGRQNYWGYSPLSWFAPHHGYVCGDEPLAGRQQLRQLVAACHDHDLEVFVDVVYNHTTEGSSQGPCLSWRGFADRLYYHQSADGIYQDVSGCGNSIAANHPLAVQLIIESMRCWALELGIDGFRFDLGAALTRGAGLTPLDQPPLFEAMGSDPELADIKLVGEPWDCGGLYRLADFPAQRVGTWNGRFRDDLRRFWKGDDNTSWAMAQRLIASPDLYGGEPAAAGKSIHFVTAHDGFTLNDLVSYNGKHNLANGEDNRDGDSHNNSWNHGVEGPSTDPAINTLRQRQMRNMLCTLLLSAGTPMLLMGDEVHRSQGGNNNCWCQNNPLGWMHWQPDDDGLALKLFVQRLLRLRQQLLPWLDPERPTELSHQWHGVDIDKPDWASWSHCLAWSINSPTQGPRLWCGMNAYYKAMHFDLPPTASGWQRVIDTGLPADEDLPAQPPGWRPPSAPLESRSLMLLVASDIELKL